MSSSLVATLSSAMASTAATPTPTSAPSSSFTGLPIPSATGNTQQDNGGGGSKQLLFFVALGFGVVFTNLWIIVGVKYCFRFNRRGQLNDDATEAIGLGTIPGHRARRRREKKLMTMEEVNERFPLTRYKTWKSAREQQGLAPEGGVTAPHSRAASLHDSEAISSIGQTQTERDADSAAGKNSSESISPDQTVAAKDLGSNGKSPASKIAPVTVAETPAEKKTVVVEHQEYAITTPTAETPSRGDDDEDRDPINDPIHSSLPDFRPEDAPAGDSCAICIDTLDDDDEVRGLTCGHAFHAGCLDPWLTGRRACCPLCKADYYVPNSTTAAEAEGGTLSGIPGSSAPVATGVRRPARSRSGMVALARPVYIGRSPARIFGGRANPRPTPAANADENATAAGASETPQPQQSDDTATQQNPDGRASRALNWFRTMPNRMPGMRNRQAAETQQVSPGQLEAGQQPATSTQTPERPAAA